MIQIGETNIIGYQPIEIIKLLSKYENRLDIHVVDEKLYKAFLNQGEFPQMSPMSFSEKGSPNSVFAYTDRDSSSEILSKTEKTEKMFDFESAPTVTPGAGNVTDMDTYCSVPYVSVFHFY